MEKVKLGDVSKLINGDRGKNYPSQADITEEGEIPFVNAGHLNGREIDFSEMNYISQDKYDNLRSGKFQEGDILYCLRGSLGKKAIVSNDVNGAIASSLVIIRPDKEKVDGEYLMFALDSPAINEQLVKANNGSSQPNLSASSVREYQVELPNISVQKEVVEKLIKVRNIIDCRRKELQLLDSLIKARFVEMFGDPVFDPMNWGQVPLKVYLESIRYGTSTPPIFSEEGYAFIRATNIKNGRIVDNDMKYISQKEADRLVKCKLLGGEIIIVRSGVNAGDTCVVTDEYINQYAGYDMILVLKSKLHPVFFNTLINTEYMDRVVKPLTRRAAQPHLNSEQIQGLPVINVPLGLQIQFADFVCQVDKSKVAVQKTLEQTQTLFDSLMQKYFG